MQGFQQNKAWYDSLTSTAMDVTSPGSEESKDRSGPCFQSPGLLDSAGVGRKKDSYLKLSKPSVCWHTPFDSYVGKNYEHDYLNTKWILQRFSLLSVV